MPRTKQSGRAAKGTGSIRKTTKINNGKEYSYWQARYTDPATGLQHSITGSTQKEVAQKLIETLNDINQGSYVAPSKQTLGQWLDVWLDTYVSHSVKPYTEDSYRSTCNVHIKPAIGSIRLSALSTLQIQRFYNRLLEQGMSPKTIKNVNGVLHKALNQAVRIGELKYNPTEACDLPKVYKKEIQPLEQDDIRRFLIAIRGHRYEILYTVTVFTGLRQGEVLGLTWDCVDFERCSLYINKQLTKTRKVGGEYILSPTKTGRSRLITVAPYVMQLLRARKEQQEADRMIAGEAWSNPSQLVFTNAAGGHLVHVTVYKDFKDIAKSLGFENARFHDLRHSYAVAAIESGDDIKTVQTNLGHATASFTLDVYGHASQRMRQRSADRMERYIHEVLDN
jgi:integrase